MQTRTADWSPTPTIFFHTVNPGHKGSHNGSAKLTEADISRIRVCYFMGETSAELAERFDLHFSTVMRIVRGELWPHVGGALPIWVRCGDGRDGPEVRRLASEGLDTSEIVRRLGIAAYRVRRLIERPVALVERAA